jgi:hypothetical protein
MKFYPAPAEEKDDHYYDPYEAIGEVLTVLNENPELKEANRDVFDRLLAIRRNQNETYSIGIPYSDLSSDPEVPANQKRVPVKDFRPNSITIEFEERVNAAGMNMTNMNIFANRKDGGRIGTAVGVTTGSGYLYTNHVLSSAIKSILRSLANKALPK